MKYIEYKNYFFVGIGGIGMSALAKYLFQNNKTIYGYDRVQSKITDQLVKAGIDISYMFNKSLTELKRLNPKNTLIVYTPAISHDNRILQYCLDKKFTLVKRAKILSEIVNEGFCIAISGTHGKTTISSILSHILFQFNLEFTSFVGGIMNDYDSNLLNNGNKIFVVEADEYDKTFLKLHPNVASIMNIDGDHYDIYSDFNDLKKSFKKFSDNLKKDGILFHDSNLDFNGFSFGLNSDSDAQVININNVSGKLTFDIKINEKIYKDIIFNMLGIHNALNALVAFIIALNLNI